MLVSCFVLVSSACSDSTDDRAKLEKINAMYQEYKKSFPHVEDLSVEELLAMQTREKVVLVDVRDPVEREASMIPGAVSADEFERDIEEFTNSTVVTYCTIGSRSGLYAKGLQAKGMRVFNLKGSILAWAHAGRKLVNDEGETRRVHVYGPGWNLLPQGYEGVW